VTITLPKLPELGGKNQGLEAGDWMVQIRPQIADVSHRAMWWWDTLVTMTTQRYQQWLGSDPITRLNVQPPAVEELPQGFTRLEQRVTSFLMHLKNLGCRDDCESSAWGCSDHLQSDEGLPARRLGAATEHPASSDNNSTCQDVPGSFHVFENVAASPFTS
jgi:hypothetical protein